MVAQGKFKSTKIDKSKAQYSHEKKNESMTFNNQTGLDYDKLSRF